MNIVKTCKKHGELTEEQCYREKNNKYKSGIAYRCKLCRMYKRAGKAYPCKVHGPRTIEQVNLDGRCSECKRDYAKKYKKENREKYLEGKKRHRENCKEYYLKRNKIDYQKKVEKYGGLLSLKKVCESRKITIQDYHDMLEAQDGRCKICKQEETRVSSRTKEPLRLCIDHCHSTNKVRGLLCHSCNTALGKFKDNIDIMKSAILYIEENN